MTFWLPPTLLECTLDKANRNWVSHLFPGTDWQQAASFVLGKNCYVLEEMSLARGWLCSFFSEKMLLKLVLSSILLFFVPVLLQKVWKVSKKFSVKLTYHLFNQLKDLLPKYSMWLKKFSWQDRLQGGKKISCTSLLIQH